VPIEERTPCTTQRSPRCEPSSPAHQGRSCTFWAQGAAQVITPPRNEQQSKATQSKATQGKATQGKATHATKPPPCMPGTMQNATTDIQTSTHHTHAHAHTHAPRTRTHTRTRTHSNVLHFNACLGSQLPCSHDSGAAKVSWGGAKSHEQPSRDRGAQNGGHAGAAQAKLIMQDLLRFVVAGQLGCPQDDRPCHCGGSACTPPVRTDTSHTHAVSETTP